MGRLFSKQLGEREARFSMDEKVEERIERRWRIFGQAEGGCLVMVNALINRREQAMDRADRAVDAAWPQRTGPDYEHEMREAAQELEAIASEMRAAGLDRIEQSRTYRYLGSVYADLEPALGKGVLVKAREAYQFAEALLQGESNESERAKLNFNYANTLRQLDPDNIELLQEAEQRFLAARDYFAAHEPKYLAQVDTALQSVTALLQIAPLANTVASNIADMASLEQELAEGGDVTQIAEKTQEVMGREGGAAGLAGRLRGLVEGLPPELRQEDAYDKVLQQLDDLSGQILNQGEVDPQEQAILSALRSRLESEYTSGAVSGDRAEAVGGVLGQLKQVLTGSEESPQQILAKLQALRQQAGAWIETMHYPSYGLPRPATTNGTRAAALVELCWALRRYLAEEMNQAGKGQEESKQALDLGMRASHVDKRLYEVGADDARAAAVDMDELRPLALAVRDFAARRHAMLARPIWSATKDPVVPGALFYSGAAVAPPALVRACRGAGLEILPRPTGASLAAARWRQLQKAMTTVFDLRVEPGPALAGVTYELGIALTLGKPIVVIIGPQQTMPFDVDIVPIALESDAGNEEALTAAIEQSLVWLHPRSQPGSIVATLNHVLMHYPRPHANMYVDQTLGMLASLRSEPDPVTVNRTLAQLVDFLEDGYTQLIHPIWQPAYSSGAEQRVFHVMPFRPDWASEVSRQAEEAVQARGGRYVRGDVVTDPDVIKSIWKEIACATHVLVDLTDFNPNVALELGIAHTLGREVLMLSQGEANEFVFPAIAKLRVETYDIQRLDVTLGRSVQRFISAGAAEVMI